MTDPAYPPARDRVDEGARGGVTFHLYRLVADHPAVARLYDHVVGLPDDDPELLVIARHAELLADVRQGGQHLERRDLDLGAEYQPGERVDELLVSPEGEVARTVTAWAAAAAGELERGGEATWAPDF